MVIDNKRARHLNSSVANWKNCRPVFDLLRKVIQGQHFLGQFWTARRVQRNVFMSDPSFLGSKVDLKKVRPWMTFLGGSNEGGRKFQFATKNYKCRPLIIRRHTGIQCWSLKDFIELLCNQFPSTSWHLLEHYPWVTELEVLGPLLNQTCPLKKMFWRHGRQASNI